MDIRSILSWVQTLSPERKEDLAGKFEAGTLSEAERKELLSHVLTAMKEVSEEVSEAKEILQALEKQTGASRE